MLKREKKEKALAAPPGQVQTGWRDELIISLSEELSVSSGTPRQYSAEEMADKTAQHRQQTEDDREWIDGVWWDGETRARTNTILLVNLSNQ